MSIIKSIIAACMLSVTMPCAYAARSLTLVVGFAPGSGNDLAARQLSKDITLNSNINIIVENKIGAGGSIALKEVINSTTPKLFLHSNSLYLGALVTKDLTVDLDTQLVPVSFIGTVPMVFETGINSNIRTFEDVVKDTSGKLTYGASQKGSLTHASMAYLSHVLKVSMTHIPYLGSVKSLVDLSADRIDLYFDFYNSSLPFIADGRVRPLAVTGSKRLKELPDVPTLKEKGIDWPLEPFYIVFANRMVDPALVKEVQQLIVKILIANPEPYNRQGIQIDPDMLKDANKVHKDSIKHYQNLNFPLGD
jgi:tripartite-type tricarboxylate transporter receptor subunit TctC